MSAGCYYKLKLFLFVVINFSLSEVQELPKLFGPLICHVSQLELSALYTEPSCRLTSVVFWFLTRTSHANTSSRAPCNMSTCKKLVHSHYPLIG